MSEALRRTRRRLMDRGEYEACVQQVKDTVGRLERSEKRHPGVAITQAASLAHRILRLLEEEVPHE